MKKVKLFLLLFLLLGMPYQKIWASYFNISASSKTVTVGSTVTIKITGSDVTGSLNISNSNAAVLSSSENSIWIEPNGSVSFKANKIGTATITFSSGSLSNDAGTDITLGSKSITINVVEKVVYSSVNNLKSLSVEGGELDPVFDSGTTKYRVEMPKGTTSVNIAAEAEDNKSTVSGAGTVEVLEGANNIEVKVTAQNGSEKVYVIVVDVLEEAIPVRVNGKDYNIIKQDRNLPVASSYYSLTTIEYEENTIPAYYSEITELTLVGLKDTDGNAYLFTYKDGEFEKYNEIAFNQPQLILLEIEDLKKVKKYKEEIITINEQEIKAYKVADNYYLVYGINIATGEKNYYLYDSLENTVQRYDEVLFANNSSKLLVGVIFISAIAIIGLIAMITIKLKRTV